MKEKLKKQSTGFTQVINSVLSNKNLSLKAKGLYALIYSKPDGWDFSTVRLKEESTDGICSTDEAIHELESAGFLTRVKRQSGKMIWFIKTKPSKNGLNIPISENRNLRKPQSAKTGDISNKENISNKEIYNNKHILSHECDEVFNFKKYLEGMKADKRRHIQIIALYWEYKGFKMQNKKQCSAAIKRDLRPASCLCGYDNGKIVSVMDYLRDTISVKWTLETIHKYIDDLDRLTINLKR